MIINQKMIEGPVINDARFEAMLDDLRVSQPQIVCDSGNRISRMCANPSCKIALLCGQSLCQSCGLKVHPVCPAVPLTGITYLLNERVTSYKEFISRALEIDTTLVDAIQESKKELTDHYQIGNNEPIFQKIVTEVYKKKNSKAINGREAKQFCQRIQQLNKITGERSAELIKGYKQAVEKIILQLKQLKKSLYDNFISNFSLDSKILQSTDEKYSQQLNFLRSSLDNPQKLELLYRGSENNFSAALFHNKCDNIPNTLTLIRTQFGKTIAGFTPYTWNAVNCQYVANADKGTFLLSLDLKEKMVPNAISQLIYCNPGYGPTFGSGHDLFIADQCNKANSSHANFPYRYNDATGKYTNNQQAKKAFSGATLNNNFKVIEYEVFRVIREVAK